MRRSFYQRLFARSAFLVLASLSAPVLTAGLDTFELPTLPVDVHPSGTDEPITSVSLLDAVDARDAVAEVRDYLWTVPGVHLDQPGGPGGRTTLYLRGGEENHTLVLLDGVPLNDPTNSRGGAVDLSLLGGGVVRRIAIVRGPASVRHGPEAVAGVVHLESASRPHARPHIFAAVGAQEFHQAGFALGAPLNELIGIDLLAVSDADGRSGDGGRHQRRFGRARVSWIGPSWAVDLSGWATRLEAQRFPDDSGGLRYARIRSLEEQLQDALGGAVSAHRDLGALRMTLRADLAEFRNASRSPGVAPGLRDDAGLPASTESTVFQRARTRLLLEQTSGPTVWAAGFDAHREHGVSRGELAFGPVTLPTDFTMERDRIGTFAELSRQLSESIRITAGGRADRFSGEGWRATWRGGLSGAFGSATTWRIHGGNAFKPPSFYAVANPLVGNPSLVPESGCTVKAAVRRHWGEHGDFAELVLFASRAENGIDFHPGPPPSLVNRDAIRHYGAEFSFSWHLSDRLRVSSALTWIDVRTDPDGRRLRGRPEWRAGLRTEWRPHRRWSLSVGIVAVDAIFDTSVPTGDVELPGWYRVDTSARWRVNNHLTLTAAIDNLLDQQFEEAVGFTSRERRARFGMQAAF